MHRILVLLALTAVFATTGCATTVYTLPGEPVPQVGETLSQAPVITEGGQLATLSRGRVRMVQPLDPETGASSMLMVVTPRDRWGTAASGFIISALAFGSLGGVLLVSSDGFDARYGAGVASLTLGSSMITPILISTVGYAVSRNPLGPPPER